MPNNGKSNKQPDCKAVTTQTDNVQLYKSANSKHEEKMQNLKLFLISFLTLLTLPLFNALADVSSDMIKFENGKPANANEVNSNFERLVTELIQVESEKAALEERVTALETLLHSIVDSERNISGNSLTVTNAVTSNSINVTRLNAPNYLVKNSTGIGNFDNPIFDMATLTDGLYKFTVVPKDARSYGFVNVGYIFISGTDRRLNLTYGDQVYVSGSQIRNKQGTGNGVQHSITVKWIE